MVKRVKVKGGEGGSAQPLLPPDGEELSGTFEFTVLNTHATKPVEIVESPSDTWGHGFPLSSGAAWSARCAGNTKLWVIAEDTTEVSVAVIGVVVPL